jgi:hypothetical protein
VRVQPAGRGLAIGVQEDDHVAAGGPRAPIARGTRVPTPQPAKHPAPAAAARSAVSSAEASSTTRISISCAASPACSRRAATVRPMQAASSRAGITTVMRVTAPPSSGRRAHLGVQVGHAAHEAHPAQLGVGIGPRGLRQPPRALGVGEDAKDAGGQTLRAGGDEDGARLVEDVAVGGGVGGDDGLLRGQVVEHLERQIGAEGTRGHEDVGHGEEARHLGSGEALQDPDPAVPADLGPSRAHQDEHRVGPDRSDGVGRLQQAVHPLVGLEVAAVEHDGRVHRDAEGPAKLRGIDARTRSAVVGEPPLAPACAGGCRAHAVAQPDAAHDVVGPPEKPALAAAEEGLERARTQSRRWASCSAMLDCMS